MSSPILPVARSLFVCDAVTADASGKLFFSGVFSSIRARMFPHADTRLTVLAQLTGGVGVVPCTIEIRHVARDEVIHSFGPVMLSFPDRVRLMNFSAVVPRCVFPYPGVYTAELFCQNQFVCDTTLLLHGPGDPP